ncbi:unnamed protein product [Rodentolepis nana]|uniref:WD_REPEATS_REGION domain-containing protein n=1 Tax=Rodentolepis nana TaxID=102285 RepID=A0A0R3TFR6_RODNA|nr:unnamed protein product [Rodentolepis nana]
MSPILSGTQSPARQRSNSSSSSAEISSSVRVSALVRDQPFPLWADLYSVLLFRSPQTATLDVDESCQAFRCIELSLTTCHRRRAPHSQLLPNALAGPSAAIPISPPTNSSTPSAFHAVSRMVKHSPVPSCGAFSEDMRLLVVGFENGTVHVLQLNCSNDPLSGFRSYRHLSISSKCSTSEPGCGEGRSTVASRDLPLDIVSSAVKVTHLSIWTPPQDFEDPELELVVGVATAGGTIHVWEIRRSRPISARCDSSFDTSQVPEMKTPPTHQWLRMHLPGPAQSTNTSDPPQTSTFSPLFPYETEVTPPSVVDQSVIVWFRLFANLEPLHQSKSSNGASVTWRGRIAWLSAGRDGFVCGRSLQSSDGDDSSWNLNLVAHKSAEITGVDVDPEGRWLATAASDGAVCVWCLSTEKKVFESSHKPLAVRCVAFRPIATANEMGTEMLLASGDAGGNLRVWRLTAPR